MTTFASWEQVGEWYKSLARDPVTVTPAIQAKADALTKGLGSNDEKVSAKPIRLYHGIADDWVPVGPCRDYVARLKKAGANIDLVEYPGATHAFDMQSIPGTMQLPQALTARKCRFEEKQQGVIIIETRSRRLTPDRRPPFKAETLRLLSASKSVRQQATKRVRPDDGAPKPGIPASCQ